MNHDFTDLEQEALIEVADDLCRVVEDPAVWTLPYTPLTSRNWSNATESLFVHEDEYGSDTIITYDRIAEWLTGWPAMRIERAKYVAHRLRLRGMPAITALGEARELVSTALAPLPPSDLTLFPSEGSKQK